MNVSLNLVSPSSEVSPIRVVITHRGKVYRKSTGLSCASKLWSKDKQKCRDVSVQKKLEAILAGLKTTLDEFSTKEDIESAIRRVEKGKWLDVSLKRRNPDVPSLWEYFEEWSKRPSGAQRQKELTYRKIREIMGENDDWDDINEPWYTKFVMKCDAMQYARNNTGIMIGRLKTVMHEGQKLGYHNNSFWREMKRFKEKTTDVYLTDEEAEKVMAYRSKSSMLDKAVDLFTLGYKTGARYSDIVRMSKDNISDGRLVYIAVKTGKVARIPLSPRVVEVFRRNGGNAPQISNQRYNDALKEVCKAVGITERVDMVVSKGSVRKHEIKEKWQCVSSHTARRSCLTNLYLSGVSARDCMVISQHTSLQTFENYLKMTEEEQLKTLEANPMFTK